MKKLIILFTIITIILSSSFAFGQDSKENKQKNTSISEKVVNILEITFDSVGYVFKETVDFLYKNFSQIIGIKDIDSKEVSQE